VSRGFLWYIKKKKTSEGRLNKGDFKDMNRLNKEDIIEFFNDETRVKKFRVKVIGKHLYKTYIRRLEI